MAISLLKETRLPARDCYSRIKRLTGAGKGRKQVRRRIVMARERRVFLSANTGDVGDVYHVCHQDHH